MTTLIALLRAINVGAANRVSMADLKQLFERLGCGTVGKRLKSGKVVFEHAKAGATLERRLGSESRKRPNLGVDYLVRSEAQWAALVAAKPFKAEAKRDPQRLLVYALKAAPAASAVQALEAAIRGPEVVKAKGRQLYVVY